MDAAPLLHVQLLRGNLAHVQTIRLLRHLVNRDIRRRQAKEISVGLLKYLKEETVDPWNHISGRLAAILGDKNWAYNYRRFGRV